MSREAKVLQVFPYYLAPDTGGESGVRSVIETTIELTSARFEHVVLTPGPSPYDTIWRDSGAIVTSLGRREHLILRRTGSPTRLARHIWQLLVDVPRIAMRIRTMRVDIVHTHSSAYLGAAIAARLARRPVIVHVHERMDALPPRLARLHRRLVALLSTRVVLIAGFMDDEWAGSHATTVSIPNTVVWSSRDQPRPQPEPGVVGFVGRIAPRKGIEHLIRALPRIRERVPTARLVVVGGPAEPEDHAYLASLREEVAAANLDQVVDFRGPTDDVASALDSFSVLGFVSPVDIAPITILEAMSRGVPIVSASAGGAEEMVADGVTGFTVEPRDDEQLADRIADVLSDAALRDRLAAAATERFERTFGPGAYRERLERLYRELLRP